MSTRQIVLGMVAAYALAYAAVWLFLRPSADCIGFWKGLFAGSRFATTVLFYSTVYLVLAGICTKCASVWFRPGGTWEGKVLTVFVGIASLASLALFAAVVQTYVDKETAWNTAQPAREWAADHAALAQDALEQPEVMQDACELLVASDGLLDDDGQRAAGISDARSRELERFIFRRRPGFRG